MKHQDSSDLLILQTSRRDHATRAQCLPTEESDPWDIVFWKSYQYRENTQAVYEKTRGAKIP